MTARERTARSALRYLAASPVHVRHVDMSAASQPGLYALHATRATWRDLGLGAPPDSRPLYVGKAETTLASRDLEGHFGMRPRGQQSPTGSSTVRRSLAALLATTRGYRGLPRNPDNPGYFSNFGLRLDDDEDLSRWMRRRLGLTLWPHSDTAALDGIETEVLAQLHPPLNLNKVKTCWQTQVKVARSVLSDQAREWAP